VNDTEIELSIGETVQVGDVSVTILDVDGEAIRFRIEPPLDLPESSIRFDMRRWLPPR
jgi:hypothetical protein